MRATIGPPGKRHSNGVSLAAGGGLTVVSGWELHVAYVQYGSAYYSSFLSLLSIFAEMNLVLRSFLVLMVIGSVAAHSLSK